MEIQIPDKVQFLTSGHTLAEGYQWKPYCFRHAVTRAMNGEDIDTELIDGYTACLDCQAEKE